MQNVATIQFRDDESQDDALVIIRAAAGQVALTLSLASDGDVEVFMPTDRARLLLHSLQDALAIADESAGPTDPPRSIG